MIYKMLLPLMVLLALTACGGGGDDSVDGIVDDSPDVSVESDLIFSASWNEDQSAAVFADVDGNVISMDFQAVVWELPNGDSVVIYYDDQGFPVRSVFDEFIFLYNNWSSDSVDIAIIEPDGTITYHKDLYIDPDIISTLISYGSLGETSSTLVVNFAASAVTINLSLSEVLDFTGKVVSAAVCGSTIAAAITATASSALVGSASLLAIAPACASTGLTLLELWGPEAIQDELEGAGVLNTIAGVIQCTDLMSAATCAGVIVDAAQIIVGIAENELDTKAEIIYNTEQGFSSPSTNGLIAYYPFNGNANDVSGNGFNGTINGATYETALKIYDKNVEMGLMGLSTEPPTQKMDTRGARTTLTAYMAT